MSDQEREQIAGAAARLELTLSGFVRQAALQASAVVEKKVVVQAPESKARKSAEGVDTSSRKKEPLAERESLGVVLLDPEPAVHMVDGEFVIR